MKSTRFTLPYIKRLMLLSTFFHVRCDAVILSTIRHFYRFVLKNKTTFLQSFGLNSPDLSTAISQSVMLH